VNSRTLQSLSEWHQETAENCLFFDSSINYSTPTCAFSECKVKIGRAMRGSVETKRAPEYQVPFFDRT
jgi:hypothetical protein